MKISVITATYNSESSIADTQRSIAQQQLSSDEMEWIVVDGASTDRTLELIRQSDFQPARIVSEPDEGIYDALNKGVRLATGDVIGFLHADDAYASTTTIAHILNAFRTDGVNAVYGDLQYIRPTSQGEYAIVRDWRSGSYAPSRLRWGWMPPHPTLYLSRSLYEQNQIEEGVWFDTTYRCAADYDFMLRLFATDQLHPVYIEEVLVRMRIGGTSNRNLKQMISKSMEDWQVIRKNEIGHLHTLLWKNAGKLRQFLPRERSGSRTEKSFE